MHDIDRTLTEVEPELDEFEADEFEFAEEAEFDGETDLETPFEEAEEMELAAELLSIQSEEELDQFLGKLLKRAGRGLRKIGRVFRPLGRVLKGVAKRRCRSSAAHWGLSFLFRGSAQLSALLWDPPSARRSKQSSRAWSRKIRNSRWPSALFASPARLQNKPRPPIPAPTRKRRRRTLSSLLRAGMCPV